MLRVLVVDDEQLMLEAVCKILTPETAVELATARTGREAIELAERFRPDLVMMDIKMPGINGLEALAEIRRFNSQAVLVILSAYENFSYAQDAIRLDVFDYLLKPVNKTRILETIRKVQAHLEQQRAARQEELALRERYQKLLPLIENEFLHALQSGIDRVALAEYQDLLGIEFAAGCFMAVLYDEARSGADDMEQKYRLRAKLIELADGIRHLFPCLVGPVKINPITVFVPLSRTDLTPAELETHYAMRIMEYFQQNHGIRCARIGIGNIYEHPGSLGRSFQEAILALNYATGQPVCFYQNYRDLTAAGGETELREQTQAIVEAVRFGHLYRVETLLNRLTVRYTGAAVTDRNLFLCEMLELLLAAYRVVREHTRASVGYPNPVQLLPAFGEYCDVAAVLEHVSRQILSLTEAIKSGRAQQVNTVILQAKQQIDQLYQEDLSLDDLAQAVAVSPFYLSRLFREELGVSFTEYVTKLRLEKALNLLADGLSVKECCFAVGYNDPNYFSRIFRKHYHVSPTEYRDDLLRRKEPLNFNE